MTEKGKPGRKSNVERERIRIEQETALKRAERESKRAKRVHPDTPHSLMVALIMAAFPVLTAGAISYFTTVSVADWMRLPAEIPWLRYVVPGMEEALVLFASLDYIISESRRKGSGRWPFWAMIGFSSINVLGNAAHTIVGWGSGFGGSHWQSYIGVILSAASAFVVVYMSKRISALVFITGEDS